MIYVAGIIYNDGINGPGLRTTVFLQGCKHACKGCHSEHTWEMNVGPTMTADELYAALTKNKLDKGITFSGGDPVYQYKKLIGVVEKLHVTHNLMLYTGFTKPYLEETANKHPDLKRFLSAFDVIVTEPFVLELRDTNLKFRGSSNQLITKPMLVENILVLKDITKEFDTDGYQITRSKQDYIRITDES
jgi:anaerobic ribonucleoside-triphosphate reductase activating protein